MQPALQALLVAPNDELRNKILSGEVTATIRKGNREYKKGPLLLACHIEPWAVLTEVTRYGYFYLRQLDPDLLRSAGYDSLEEALEGLKKSYDDIDENSVVTFIEWGELSGTLVE